MSDAITASLPESEWRSAERPDLRRGVWTRLGDERVLGDETTETVLGSLAARARSAARAEGYAVGWSQGHSAALRRAEEEAAAAAAAHEQREQVRAAEHAQAIAALTAAAAALSTAATRIATQIGEQATDLAFEVTRTVLCHELESATDPGVGVVARALAVLPAEPAVTVRLHPDAAASPATADLAAHGVRLVADPGLDRHDAIVETDTTAVDLRIAEALDRLREALS